VTEDDEMPLHLRLMKNVYTSAPLLFQEAVFPRKFDNFINTVQSMRLEYYLKDLASRATDIGEVRTASGRELNPLDSTQRIAPDELQMNERQMHWLRSTLEMSGTTLERMMFDYWKRLKSTPESERPNIPLISDPLVAESVLRAFAQTGNVIRETNSISSSRGSAVRKIAFTLGSYSANLLDQLIKIVPAYSEAGLWKQAANLALFAFAASAMGITAFELRRRLVEAFTGKTSSQPSLANIAQHPLSSDAQTYLLNAVANEIPYLGLATQHLFDTGTGRSIFDLADMVPLAGLVRDSGQAIEKAINTGSVALPLEEFISRRAPLYSSVVNRVPPLSGEILSGEAVRAMRAATPRAMQKPSGGYAPNVGSKSTRFLRSAQAAELQGDDRTAGNLIKQAVQQRMAERPGISQAQATSQLRSSIASRNSETQVLGRKLKSTELSATLDRMTPAQRRSFTTGVAATRTLLSLLPHTPDNNGHSIFKSHQVQPIFKRQRKLKSLLQI
jgi:hypothetical protein